MKKEMCITYNETCETSIFFIFKFVYFKLRLNSNLGKFFENIMVALKGQCHEFFYEKEIVSHKKKLVKLPFSYFQICIFQAKDKQ